MAFLSFHPSFQNIVGEPQLSRFFRIIRVESSFNYQPLCFYIPDKLFRLISRHAFG